MFLIAGIFGLGMFMGFSNNDLPTGSKTRTTPTEHYQSNPSEVTAAYYTDNFDGTNDTTALKARGYKVYYRGGGAQGTTATWFQGNDVVFPAFNGPPTGYVAANYNAVTGLNNIDSWLVLPGLNVGSGDTISFYSQAPLNSTFPDSVRVMFSAAGDSVPEAASWVELGRFKVNILGTWEKKSFRTSSAGANGRFAIRYAVVQGGPLGNNSDFIGIDALNISSAGGGPPVCNYMWSSQTSGTANTFYSVSAVSDQVCWTAGVASTVRKTTNGGLTWTDGNSTPGTIAGDIYNIYAWSENDALCTTSPAASNIYKTTNGGTTWTLSHSVAGGFINAIQMVSATEGYATGDPVGGIWEFLKTTNGGATWAQVATAPAQVGAEAGWNNSFSILGTNIWWGTNSTKVYRSTDMGVTWSSGASTGSVNTYALHYNNPTTGIAGGTATVKSADGGATYTAATSPGVSGNINGFEGVGTDWWGIRSGATVYRSTNGATTWTDAYTQTGAVYQDIDFVIVNGCPVGWSVGNLGVVSKMSNITGISNIGGEVPVDYTLGQNYPNPFNPEIGRAHV